MGQEKVGGRISYGMRWARFIEGLEIEERYVIMGDGGMVITT